MAMSNLIKSSRGSGRVSGKERSDNWLHNNIDRSRDQSAIELKISEILAKWKKNPEAANSPTLEEASKKLVDFSTNELFSTEELINMYNNNHPNTQYDRGYLTEKCDPCDPENVIAYRRWREEEVRQKRAA